MKYVTRLFAVLGALLALPSVVSAQSGANIRGIQVAPFEGKRVAQTVSAADTEPVLFIKYFPPVGSATGASTTTVAVEANSDLTFVVNGAAYTGFECPVSGALGGVIDVSDAACNTLGEVVDIINSTAKTFSTGYFRAAIANGLRTDTSDSNFLADAADNEVTTPSGEVVLWDSSNADDINLALLDRNLGGREYFPEGSRGVVKNPFADSVNVLQYASIQVTNAGTIGDYEVHCVVENYLDGGKSSEVDNIIYKEAGAATTVVGKVDEFLNAGGLDCPGGKLLLRALASGADTSVFNGVLTGYRAPLRVR